jgi:hypothetical protein
VYHNRRRIRGARGQRFLRLRGERLERPFAHLYETGGLRRVYLRGHTAGYMRLLKESVLRIWKTRKASAREAIATAERAVKAIQEKLDRLDEAFLFERSIDIETYDRHAEKLREALTLVRIDRHSGQLEELDVEGILAFAERVLPRAADLWVQASLKQRQRFQQLFFPDGIAFDENGFVRTAVPHRRSATCGRFRLGMKVWWT